MKKKASKKTAKKPSKKSHLPSAVLPTPHLAEVGARFSTAALIKLANVVLGKVRKQPAFARYGFGPAWILAMNGQLVTISGAHGQLRVARDAVLPTSKALVDAVSAGKEWRRRAATSVALTPGASRHFLATGSSTKKLAASIEDLLPRVSARETAPYGGGPALAKEGKDALGKLVAASSKHVAAAGEVSPEVRALNAQKGILYEELQRVARAARMVVPAESPLYAPSQHLHAASQSRKKKKPKPVTPAAPPG